MKNRKAVIAAVFIVLVAAGAAWALGMFSSNAQFAELNQLRQQMFASRDLPDEQRQQLRGQFRQRIESLSDSERQQFFENSRGEWMQHAQERMDEFFALPAQERQARLDQMIDHMAQRQRERAQNPNAANNRGPGNGPPGGPGGGPGAGPGGRGRGGWANMTEAQREQRAKQRLDRTTPKMRAQRNEFRRQLTQRLEERGLNPDDFHGGFHGGWGRRG